MFIHKMVLITVFYLKNVTLIRLYRLSESGSKLTATG